MGQVKVEVSVANGVYQKLEFTVLEGRYESVYIEALNEYLDDKYPGGWALCDEEEN